ncbi:hypothetical protein HZS_0 [Henneguya salminicola]|nr:hypothetical protein HZS_0 [Henneguya salminicola]
MASTLKCAILPMTKFLPANDLLYATNTEDTLAYKYLGIKEKSTPCSLLSRELTQKSIPASITLIMNTFLSARNKVKAINMLALSKLNFSVPFLIFPITACTELMKKITSTLHQTQKLQRVYYLMSREDLESFPLFTCTQQHCPESINISKTRLNQPFNCAQPYMKKQPHTCESKQLSYPLLRPK